MKIPAQSVRFQHFRSLSRRNGRNYGFGWPDRVADSELHLPANPHRASSEFWGFHYCGPPTFRTFWRGLVRTIRAGCWFQKYWFMNRCVLGIVRWAFCLQAHSQRNAPWEMKSVTPLCVSPRFEVGKETSYQICWAPVTIAAINYITYDIQWARATVSTIDAAPSTYVEPCNTFSWL